MRSSSILVAAAAVAALAAPTAASAQGTGSDDIPEAVEIKPGVAVLFFRQGGNVGVSYGEDGTILIDDQFAEKTENLQAAVASLGASPAKYVINTHWHYDHAEGNANMGEAGAIIVAHETVRVRLIGGGDVHGYYTSPAPKIALPVVTFDEGLTFHLNGDEIDVIHHGGGHTDGDAIVYWRKANVLHTGDMYMKDLGWPFIDLGSGGNVEHMLNTLSRMIALADAETVIIPGHGPLATRSDLIAFRDMVEAGMKKVVAYREAGGTLETAISENIVAGMRNAEGFISDEDFIKGVWGSLDSHGH